jgi:tetratricopeptide (TPR) repeat protein
MRKQILPSVNEIIRRGCDAQKPWAYVAKAWLTESTESDWNAAYEDLGKAIGLEPDNANLYFARAMSQLYHRQYTGAEQDLKRALDLGLQGSRLPYAHFHLGHCNRILGDYTEALQHLSRAIKMQPNDTSFLYGRALTLYATGRYSDAELEIEKAIKTDPAKENTKILGAHVAASLGKAERAAEILDSVRSQVEIAPILSLSLAEAYLVILPEETLRILDAYPEIVKDNNAIASFLRAFAAVLLNAAATSGEETIDIARTDSPQEETIWEVTELEEFLKWASAAGQISESQHTTLSKLVKATGWSHRAA